MAVASGYLPLDFGVYRKSHPLISTFPSSVDCRRPELALGDALEPSSLDVLRLERSASPRPQWAEKKSAAHSADDDAAGGLRFAYPPYDQVLLRCGAHRDVRFEKSAHAVDRALSQLLWLLPRVNRDLGVRRQRGDIDRGLQRMPWYVIRQHQHRRAAVPDEVTRHALQEIGLHGV